MHIEPIHTLRQSQVYQTLETSQAGLSIADVKSRLALYGYNILSDPIQSSLWQRWVSYIIHPMAILLWLAGIVISITGRPVIGIFIWCIVLINATFSFWHEYRAGKTVETLKTLLPIHARVIREGKDTQIPASEIVPGDILVLAEGDNIPADARVVEEYGLRVNNGTLTGETLPVRKIADASMRDDLSEIERPNLIFAGTSLVSGTCHAIVYATGMLTQFGRIANLTQWVKEDPSLLQLEMRQLTRKLSIIALIFGLIVFFVGITDVGLPQFEAITLAIGILVATLPEGLVPTVTLTLAMAVQRLAQRGILVKKLAIVETLGTTSVICTDKSGTLTQNQMTVRKIWVDKQLFDIEGVGYDPTGEIIPNLKNESLKINPEILNSFFTAALLCNNARLTAPKVDHPNWSCLGDQTEAALIVLSLKNNLKEDIVKQNYPRIHELPFDARRKRMTTIHSHGDEEIAFVKGAPREIIQLCTHFLHDNQVFPLDNITRLEILSANDDFSCQSLRVLALASRVLPHRKGEYTPEGVERELVFLGLAAMMDPPKPEVASAMKRLQSASIRVVMITGDYGLTAESLARRIGMLTTPMPRIITGADLDEMNDEEIQVILKNENIFARMAPEHKLRLVAAFQNQGDVVAVIGDGVNDAPALRKADIGIAMGINGTDVAKEAADVILIDDNFSSVIHAIEEGRAIYDNLRKFISYIFASNIPEILPFLLTALFKIPLALTVIQILAIDLGTDLLPALALGMEKPEPGIMKHPPRKRAQPIVDVKLILRSVLWLGAIEAILCYVGFFLVFDRNILITLNIPSLYIFFPQDVYFHSSKYLYLLATTVFHAGVVTSQIGNVFACRSERINVRWLGWFSNPYVWVGVLFEILLILSIIYFPIPALILGHVSIPPIFWIWLGSFAPILYGLERVRKTIWHRIGAK
ncbi:MAG: cation-transporting P-type ATPase [Chloroflexota bacterium]